MLRLTRAARGTVYLKIVDFSREADMTTRVGKGFNVPVDMGAGVEELTVPQLQDLLDNSLARHSRYGTVRTGRVFSEDNIPVTKVHAKGRYIVTGNMRGGFIKSDPRFGFRLSGYHGATNKPGLRWNGDEI